jgi:predicted metal-dependent hydrolase
MREAAIKELQISDNKARCQKCDLAVPLTDASVPSNSQSTRIRYLKRRIEFMHKHAYDIDKSTKDELAQLTKEEDKNELLKRLRHYSSKLTRYRFFCSTCFDNAYRRKSGKRKLI